MEVVFRADASVDIGTGHVMRCLTLADALGRAGARCTFVSRALDGHLLEAIAARGHGVLPLSGRSGEAEEALAAAWGDARPAHAAWLATSWQADASETREALEASGLRPDWLVVDHYALDARWEEALEGSSRRLMVLDDLADRTHRCDLLLEQGLGREAADYGPWVPQRARLLIGPRFALLRPEFAALRSASLARRAAPRLSRLLVTLGGVDRDNVTGRVLAALRTLPLGPELSITVVMGARAPWKQQIEQDAQQMPWPTEVLSGVTDMGARMAAHDLAICAGGGTVWELCALGVPMITVVVADNQTFSARALAQRAGVPVITPGGLQRSLAAALRGLEAPVTLRERGRAVATVCDGRGADRVVAAMDEA